MDALINHLLKSDEPSIRYKTRVHVLGENPDSERIRLLQREIQKSPRVASLLRNREPSGRLMPLKNPYQKWRGAHWVLASLADIGYPRNDESLRPIIDQVLDCWLAPYYRYQVPIIEGKARRCASQQGNALFSILRLCDWQDDRVDSLVRLLLSWQWPDGGWNCDVRPEAKISSFWESLIPLRALALYAKLKSNPEVSVACRRAAEIFLARKMYLSRSTGTVMHKDFIQLHYPCYWHYDILFGLKVMVEAGFIDHPDCAQALDLLESKRLTDGGWPAEAKYYRILKSQPTRTVSNVDHIAWGGVSKSRINEWVTVDALHVLRAAGRLSF